MNILLDIIKKNQWKSRYDADMWINQAKYEQKSFENQSKKALELQTNDDVPAALLECIS